MIPLLSVLIPLWEGAQVAPPKLEQSYVPRLLVAKASYRISDRASLVETCWWNGDHYEMYAGVRYVLVGKDDTR